MLRAAGHGGLDLGGRRSAVTARARWRGTLAGGGALGHQAHHLLVHARVEGGEGDVLQLPLDGVHAEAVGQRRVDLEGLAGLLLREAAGTNFHVRALCSRSASLMTSTRMSLAIATTILRTVSAWAASP